MEDAVVAAGFWPKSPPLVVAAGFAAPWPKREGVAAPEGCAAEEAGVVLAAPAPPKREGVEEGWDEGWAPPRLSEGAPAGVVEVIPPNEGLAGVA